MKQMLVLAVILLTAGTYSQAQDISGGIVLDSNNLIAQISVVGSGNYVCSAESSFGHVPVIARGQSKKEAQVRALQACAATSSQNSTLFCEVTSCERDRLNGDGISVVFDVVRDNANVTIGFSGKVKYACYSSAWNSLYVAKAPTKTEALALVKSICAYDEGTRKGTEPNGFFCEADVRDCEQIEGVKGGFSLGSLLDLFK